MRAIQPCALLREPVKWERKRKTWKRKTALTEGGAGGEKISVSFGDRHLGSESEAGTVTSERRTAKTKARAERG